MRTREVGFSTRWIFMRISEVSMLDVLFIDDDYSENIVFDRVGEFE